MKLFAYHSQAIEPLWQIFSKSVREKTSFEFMPQEIPKEFDGVKYGETAYWRLMRWMGLDKLRLLKENFGSIITITGCDMEFYGDANQDLMQRIAGYDFLTPENAPGTGTSCGCLQVFRAGRATFDFYQAVYHDKAIGTVPDDPLIDKYRHMVKYVLLPRELYWNIAAQPWLVDADNPKPPRGMFWNIAVQPWPVDVNRLRPNKGIIWAHFNFVVGLEKKLALREKIVLAMAER